jgi:glycosyltransferase involved in cell wall biosynthesis
MNILINTHLLLKGKLDGIGWFTFETIRRITRDHPEHNFYLIFDRKPPEEFRFSDNITCLTLYPPARHPLLWLIRFEIFLPFLIRKLKADVFVTPDGWMTLGTSVPCVQVIHDINFVHNPKDTPYLSEKYYNIMFPKYARRAKRIVTVSNFSKQDIADTFGVPEEKIDVAYNGCNTLYMPLEEEQNRITREQFTGGNPYFVYVGAIIPRKNIARLFMAFDLFKKRDTQNVKLLIIGNWSWWTPEIEKAFKEMEFREDVIFEGRKNALELNRLYSASIALAFVPYFEGFGIPILEAFNSGTAVITSNKTSMPEVAGDAAILVDPFSVDEIAGAMVKISQNHNLRNELISKGIERAKLFSWDNTASVLWNSIEKAVSTE